MTPTEALQGLKKQHDETLARIAQLYQELHFLERQRDMQANALQGAELGARAQNDQHEADEAARVAEREAAEAVATGDGVTLTAKAEK